MKKASLLLVLPVIAVLAACEQKPASTTEQIKDKVNDALDRRPNEKLKDAGEDLRDGAKSAVKDLKDATK
jgi:ABC-type transporter MlaC component